MGCSFWATGCFPQRELIICSTLFAAWGIGFVLYFAVKVSSGFMHLVVERSLLFYAMVNEVPDGKMWNRFFTA